MDACQFSVLRCETCNEIVEVMDLIHVGETLVHRTFQLLRQACQLLGMSPLQCFDGIHKVGDVCHVFGLFHA